MKIHARAVNRRQVVRVQLPGGEVTLAAGDGRFRVMDVNASGKLSAAIGGTCHSVTKGTVLRLTPSGGAGKPIMVGVVEHIAVEKPPKPAAEKAAS